MTSHSSSRGESRWAARTRILAKRERSGSDTPWRQVTLVSLARLSAVLPRHANRTGPFLRKARVVDDPVTDAATTGKRWQNQSGYRRQQGFITPLGVCYQVMH